MWNEAYFCSYWMDKSTRPIWLPYTFTFCHHDSFPIRLSEPCRHDFLSVIYVKFWFVGSIHSCIYSKPVNIRRYWGPNRVNLSSSLLCLHNRFFFFFLLDWSSSFQKLDQFQLLFCWWTIEQLTSDQGLNFF